MKVSTEHVWYALHEPIRSFIDKRIADKESVEDLLQEVFIRLGLSFSGAKSRVQRARGKLKQLLLDCCHFELDRFGQVIDYQPRCGCCTQMEAWAGCIAGALEEESYQCLLAEAGFTAIEVEVTQRYGLQEIAESGASTSIAALSQEELSELDGKFVSAFIRARKLL